MPIIIGSPRSGTTLLRLMLDGHPQLAITHEAGFIPVTSNLTNPLSRMFYKRLLNGTRYGSWSNLRDEFYRTITTLNNWNDFHISKNTFKQNLAELEPFTISNGTRLFFRMYANRFGKQRWGDKTPFYTRYLQVVNRILPEAHFIHIIRDGRDAAVSGKGLPFVGNDIETIALNWCKDIISARSQARSCTYYIEVRYEDLVLHTTEVLRKICAFISLPYEPSMELYYTRASDRLGELSTIYKPDGSVDVTQKARLDRHRLTALAPQSSRIGRWKTQMTKKDLSVFHKVAGKLLQELHYEK